MRVHTIWPNAGNVMLTTAQHSVGWWTPEIEVQYQTLVRERSGLSFDQNRIGKLFEGVEDRMATLGLTTPVEYWQRLENDQDEFGSLVSLLTVNETYFFRGIEELNLCVDVVLPAFVEALHHTGQGYRPLSIVSAGCSSGEEPYSIAMALLERHGVSIPFMVYGGDVDLKSLATARTGLYGENAFRQCDTTMQGRYFVSEAANKKRVVDQVREKVRFFTLNLMSDSYPFPVHGADFIFYRNVSIYFDEQIKKKIFSQLVAHLTPGGCLFLSPAEIFFHNQPDVLPKSLYLEDRQGRFFFRKQLLHGSLPRQHAKAEQRRETAAYAVVNNPVETIQESLAGQSLEKSASVDLLSLVAEVTESGAGDAGQEETQKKRLAKVVRWARDKRYEKALTQLDLYLLDYPTHLQAIILKAAILLGSSDDQEQAKLVTAKALCRGVLAQDLLCYEALLLLAMVLYREGVDPMAAMTHLKSAIFLQPSRWLPHFYLAQTYELLGETAMAAQEYQVVIYRMGQPGGWLDHGLDFLPLSLSLDELVNFCRFRLKQMHLS